MSKPLNGPKCGQCLQPVEVPKHRRKNAVFCSKKCMDRWRKTDMEWDEYFESEQHARDLAEWEAYCRSLEGGGK